MPDWRSEIREQLEGFKLDAARESAIIEEISQHLDDTYEELIANGATSEDAVRASLDEIREEALRGQLKRCSPKPSVETIALGSPRRSGMFGGFLQDVRFGVRMLRKHPLVTAIAVISLALGIGANTAIFSLVNELILKPLPVERPDQLVAVQTTSATRPGPPFSSFSYPLFRELRERNDVFAGLFAHSTTPMSLSGSGQAERVLGELVTGNFFQVLGVGAQVGRVFNDEDNQQAGGHPIAVLGDRYWRRRFAADPGVIGKTISLNGYPFTVVGVSGREFQGLEAGVVPDVRIPIVMDPQVRPRGGSAPSILDDRRSWWMGVTGRLKPGLQIATAQASLDAVFQTAREPDIRKNTGDSQDDRAFKSQQILLTSARTGLAGIGSQLSQPLFLLMILVAVVLLIACLNVANLLIERAMSRRKEIALRLALGARRGRLIRQLWTESLLLSLIGGTLGLLMARWGVQLLVAFIPQRRLPVSIEITPDARILGFTLGMTLLTGMIFGLMPALQATRRDLVPTLKGEQLVASRRFRFLEFGRILVVLQIALSLVLLVGAGLFARSLRNLRTTNAGYGSEQIVTMSLDPAQMGYNRERLRSFYTSLSERVSGLPGIATVTFARNIPMSGSYSRFGIEIPGYRPRPGEEMAVLFNQVGARFFTAFGTPLSAGREFNDQDTPQSPKVAVINQALTRRFFGDESPIGKRITLENYKDLEIVGVVMDAKYRNLRETPPLTAFIPYSQYDNMGQRAFCVRGRGTVEEMVAGIREQIRALDPNLPIFNVKTFAEQIDESVSQDRLLATLSSFFGVFAVLLASIGLYGVVSNSVSRRTRELGIRIALGADRSRIMRFVLRETSVLVLVGIGVGLPAALITSRLTVGLLFGLTPNDPLTIVMATLVMAMIALIAVYVPARRAGNVDPLVALRSE